MAKILCIESAQQVCSVCMAVDGKAQWLHESAMPCDHSRTLAPYIKDIFAQSGITAHDLDAIAISQGPGSYTGLRIGAATAKGLCYAAAKPLIAIGTLDALAQLALPCAHKICVVIDARRMEVYAAFFDEHGTRTSPDMPVVLDEHSFDSELSQHKTIFVGSGAEKCREILRHDNAAFLPMPASAAGLAPLAQSSFDHAQFVDLACFEPFYLKSFSATQAKRGMRRI